MKGRLLKLFVEIIYIIIMGIILIFTIYNKLGIGHYIIVCLFNIVFIQLIEMFETRTNHFLTYKFGISSFILLFTLFIYFQDVDSYFAHILLLIINLLLLSNWHFILDNKIYRTYNIWMWTLVTIYSLIGYLILSGNRELLEIYLLSSVLLIMFISIVYFFMNYQRITNYMEYKKNIVIFLIVSWLVLGVLYLKMRLIDSANSTVELFLIISCFQYFIQNIFLSYYTGIIFEIKKYIMAFISIGILIFITKFYLILTIFLLITHFVYMIQNHTKFALQSKKTIENQYLMKIHQLNNELKYNKELSNYLHDSILQDIIYLKKAVDNKDISKGDVSDILSAIINKVRLKLDNLSPLLYLDKSLYENLCLNITQIKNRHLDKNMVLDLFCDEKIYLENPYDELLVMIVKELINNMYKHTESNFGEIKIYVENSILYINSFNDEGFLDENLLYQNNRFSGLLQIHRMIYMVGGNICIKNSEGVNIIINIPLKGGNIIENSISRRS